MSKYDVLSGVGYSLTTTPYGLLETLILWGECKIYIMKNSNAVSVDLFSWEEVNNGLYKKLKKLVGDNNNIIMLKDWKEVEKYREKKI